MPVVLRAVCHKAPEWPAAGLFTDAVLYFVPPHVLDPWGGRLEGSMLMDCSLWTISGTLAWSDGGIVTGFLAGPSGDVTRIPGFDSSTGHHFCAFLDLYWFVANYSVVSLFLPFGKRGRGHGTQGRPSSLDTCGKHRVVSINLSAASPRGIQLRGQFPQPVNHAVSAASFSVLSVPGGSGHRVVPFCD